MTTKFADWGIATSTIPGETVSGDRGLVSVLPDGLLIAGVDGLGHGREARRAADAVIDALHSNAERPLDDLMRLCQRALLGTRGAVLIVACYSAVDRSLYWTGLGDLIGVLMRADPLDRPQREILVPQAGVMGRGSGPSARGCLPIHDGDLLVIATDGVRPEFVETLRPGEDPARLAERVLAAHRKLTDDALVVAARFREIAT